VGVACGLTLQLRFNGSAGLNLALVASGAADAYFEKGVHVWDFAAGSLLVTESGGVVSSIAGGDLNLVGREVMAGSGAIVSKLVSLLKS
jgi:myo-inositol-1(or 4)-monophosphatase